MPGGRTVGAVRIAAAVHRTSQPWTPTVHAVLQHLEAVGFGGARRVLGYREQGREIPAFLPGTTVGGRLELLGQRADTCARFTPLIPEAAPDLLEPTIHGS